MSHENAGRKYDEAKRDLSTLTSVELDKLNIKMLDHHDKLMSDVKHSQKILDQIVKEQLTRYRNANSKANY